MFLVRNSNLTPVLIKDDYLDVEIGTGGAVDLEDLFTHEQLYRSSLPGTGGLYLAIQSGNIIRRNDTDTITLSAATAFDDPVWRWAPRRNEKEALSGTRGYASDQNRYVTEEDYGVRTTLQTTTAAAGILTSVLIPNNSVVLIETRVVAVRTGGSQGTTGDSATFIRISRFKNVGGIVTRHTIESDYTSADQTSWAATIDVSGQNAQVIVKGNVGNAINWRGITRTETLSF